MRVASICAQFALAALVCAAMLTGCMKTAEEPSRDFLADKESASEKAQEGTEGKSASGDEGGDVASKPGVARKIVYHAEVDLVVEDFSPVSNKVQALITQFDAFVAHSSVGGYRGRPRRGEWRVRVPAAQFEAFLEAARGLGEVRNVTTRSQEVTEEYYDVESRIRNSKQEESRLLELLEERTGKLEDVLAVEREIARVRGEIEGMEGRLRVLSDLTSLATVTLRFEEIRDYRPEHAATFGTQIRRSFQSSWSAVVYTSQNLLLALVWLAPWLVVLGIPAALVVALLTRLLRRRAARS